AAPGRRGEAGGDEVEGGHGVGVDPGDGDDPGGFRLDDGLAVEVGDRGGERAVGRAAGAAGAGLLAAAAGAGGEGGGGEQGQRDERAAGDRHSGSSWVEATVHRDRKSTRLNSSHVSI